MEKFSPVFSFFGYGRGHRAKKEQYKQQKCPGRQYWGIHRMHVFYSIIDRSEGGKGCKLLMDFNASLSNLNNS
jgi:hypothetical protein